MSETNWLRQTKQRPLFEDLIWSRPETKWLGGKLFIAGGNIHGFSAVAEAFASASSAGIGTAQLVLPDKLMKTIRKLSLEEADFGSSTPSGSFSQGALALFLEKADWADGTLLAGDFGHNSETAILLEKFASKNDGQLTITKDAADYFISLPTPIIQRPKTLLVISIAQFQKLIRELHSPTAITFDMDIFRLSQALSDFSAKYPLSLIIKHLTNIFVTDNGQVSVTTMDKDKGMWRVPTAATAATWWLQNPTKTFESLTTSVID